LPPLKAQKSPAEQRFVGGVFALSACYLGKAADLLHCLRVYALFALRFFCLRTSPPTLSPAWSPISASRRCRLVRLVLILRRKLAILYTRARPAYAAGSGLSLPVIHASTLWSDVSALEASAASALHCLTSTLKASAASTLHCGASTLKASATSTLHCRTSALKTSTASTLHCGASALKASAASTLEALAESAHTSTLEALTESTRASALDVLIRTLSERAIWARYPEITRLWGLEVCSHSWPSGHSASYSRTAAATSAASPYLSAAASKTSAASAPTGKRLTGQNRYCQCNNESCFDSCLFHFRFLSLTFHFSAFLGPILGSFYRDSGPGGKKVTPGVNFSEKLFVLAIEKTGRLKTYRAISVAIYFTSMFRLSCKSGIKTRNWNFTP